MISTTERPQNEAVEKQLRDLEHQNGGMATFAHWCAGLLLFAFSLGSLISISHAAFIKFLSAANAGQLDIPDGISLLVNILLILACDVGMLYAASVLRVLNANGAPKHHKTVHQWALWGAAGLESITYLYLAWIFDRPDTWFLWGIMIARAIASPLFAAYLSMARALPVGPGDVAYHASLASGRGVVRDVATLAADPDASLERKVRIYRASAQMTAQDRTRFDGIVEAVSEQDPRAVAAADAPPPTPPDDRPRRDSRPRRDTGRRVDETEELKRQAKPHVLKLARAKVSQRDIVAALKDNFGIEITQFMVREIINDAAARQEKRQRKQQVRRVS